MVHGSADENDNGVWFTTTENELTKIQALADKATVTNYGFGENGEISAREAWSKLRPDPIPAIARGKLARMVQPQYVTIATATMMGLIAWRVTSILMASRDLPIAAGLLAGAVPFYVDPEDRGPVILAFFNFILGIVYLAVRLENRHGPVTCTLVGMFFLIRGTSGAEVDASWPTDSSAYIRGGTPSDEPDDDADDKTDERIDSDHPEAAMATAINQPLSPHCRMPTPTSMPCCPLLPPRADLLTPDEAGQLHQELLAGCEVPEGLPKSITRPRAG